MRRPSPPIAWTPELIGLLVFASVFGVTVAYWTMAIVQPQPSAVTTSLDILATPVGMLGPAIVPLSLSP